MSVQTFILLLFSFFRNGILHEHIYKHILKIKETTIHYINRRIQSWQISNLTHVKQALSI